jgi:hypothetical protein
MQLQAQPGDLVGLGINAPVVLDDICFDLESFQAAWLVDDLLACERANVRTCDLLAGEQLAIALSCAPCSLGAVILQAAPARID